MNGLSSSASSLRSRSRRVDLASDGSIDAAGATGTGIGTGGSSTFPSSSSVINGTTTSATSFSSTSISSKQKDHYQSPSTFLLLSSFLSTISQSIFHSLGRSISTNQIRSLLLSGLLICSLLSPTLLLYFSPTGPVPLASSSIARRGRGEFVWELEPIKRQGIITSEDSVCWDQFVRYYEWRKVEARLVRVEQILVSPISSSQLERKRRRGGSGIGVGALSKSTLHKAYQLQNELATRLKRGDLNGLTCVKDQDGECAISSPVEWWNDEQELLKDQDLHRTISKGSPSLRKLREGGDQARTVPLTTANTLVGIGRDRKGLVKHAHHLVITFYLEDVASTTSGEHNSSLTMHGIASISEEKARESARRVWKQAVDDVVSGKGWSTKREQVGTVVEGRGPGKRITLKHLPWLNVHPNPRLLEDIIYLSSYLVIIIYAARAIRRLPEVHSKSGLILTGVVEMTASGIMSLSLGWLFDWSFALVPWNLCIFLIMVCGIDNMLLLVNAVGRTDMSLPVPERVAIALASEGPSATLTLLGELAICQFMRWFIQIEVMREILLVIEVVLIVDFGLEITFFATILSIDLQRLELADLLRGQASNPPLLPSTPSDFGDNDLDSSRRAPLPGTWSHAFQCAKRIVRDRPAAMTTFLLLFLIDANLYIFYGRDHFLPAFCSETALSTHRPLLAPSLSREIARSLQLGQRGESAKHDEVIAGAGAAFWRLLNPSNTSSAVHLYVEPVSIVRFYDDGMLAPESASIAAAAIVSTPWWIKIGIIAAPIVFTLGVLYLLLLYLLKDAELLQVQRLYSKQRKDAKGPSREATRKNVPEARVSITTLRPRPESADVELIASSRDAIVTWAALDEQISLWRVDLGRNLCLEPSFLDIPLAAEPPSLVALALDPAAKFCAAATMMGRILVWDLERRLLIDFAMPSRVSLGSASYLFAAPSSIASNTFREQDAPPRSSMTSKSTSTPAERHAFVSVHQDGTIVVWDCVTRLSTIVHRPEAFVSSESSPPASSDSNASQSAVAKIKQFVVFPPQSTISPLWPLSARVSSTTGQVHLTQSTAAGTTSAEAWQLIWNAQITSNTDPITAIAFGRFELGLDSSKAARTIVVLGRLGGSVSVYILPESGEPLPVDASPSLTLSLDGAVRQIRLAAGSKKGDKCRRCNESISDGFFLVASSRTSVYVDRIFTAAHSGCSVCSGLFEFVRRNEFGADRTGASSSMMKRSGSSSSMSGNGGGSIRTPKKSNRRPSQGSEVEPSPNITTTPSKYVSVGSPTRPRNGSPPLSVPPRDSPSPATSENSSPRPNPVSTTEGGVPLFSTTNDSTSDAVSARPKPYQLHAIEIDRCLNDERGGWDLIERSIIGLRRQRDPATSSSSSSSSTRMHWFVWSIGLGLGSIEGITSLDSLLSRSFPSDTDSKTNSSTMYRRRPTSPPLRTPSIPSIRFEPSDLPFSRARPIVTGLGDARLIVGLANQIVVIKLDPIGRFNRSQPTAGGATGLLTNSMVMGNWVS